MAERPLPRGPLGDAVARRRFNEPLPIVIAAQDQLVLRRMASALAADGFTPTTLLGDESAATSVAPDGILAFSCNVADSARIASLRRVRKSASRAHIVVVSPASNGTDVRRALEAGADGVVFELALEETLVPCLVAVAAGHVAVPRNLRGSLSKPTFSHRERQILWCIGEGLTNSQIADRLFLSESTVKSHVSSAFTKLGVKSRKEAAAFVLDDCRGAQLFVSASTPVAGGHPSKPE